MSTNVPQNNDNQEIDLFQISKKIGNLFQELNAFIFRCIQFFVKNGVIILILLIVGFGLGYYLDKNQKEYNHQIIVAPNFKSTDYLYSKIDLLASKISEKDVLFLKSIGINDPSQLTKISIEPIVDVYKLISNNEQNFELLELMAQNGDLKTIVKESTTSKNYNFHTIILSTNGVTRQSDFIDPILNYLNSSSYFQEIQKISVGNIQQKIKEKEATVLQIDGIVNAFSNRNGNAQNSDKLIYYNENSQLNDIIKTKDSLVNVLGTLKIDLFNARKVINDNAVILNIKNNKSINGKMKLVLPILFTSLFIIFGFILSFYKSQSLNAK
ncbi:hypothetical protein SAMN05443667_102298 [Flavobacterium gillisiae]|uniref:Chain length determinant protein n=1 Tax=Flavobacterium gillisiae TaxID=150146 RepID=A0A1H3Z8I3_9FLAO|nr:hypothetical protein [Flavobacterium gillisiae]SEA19977.1 hypothetical protein SAMN05443667_102298 [Flavobacterium gillisiae]